MRNFAMFAIFIVGFSSISCSAPSDKTITQNELIRYQTFDGKEDRNWLLPTYPKPDKPLPAGATIMDMGFKGTIQLGQCVSVIAPDGHTTTIPIFRAGDAVRDNQGRLVIDNKIYADGDEFLAGVSAYGWGESDKDKEEASRLKEICGGENSVFVLYAAF